MAVFDCCMVYQELDMLELRLNTLKDVVDHFVVVEAGQTHSGKPKPRYLNDALNAGRFAEFAGRMSYVYVPELLGTTSWDRERYNRDCIGRGLWGSIDNDDWVIVADCDEIPKPEAVRAVIESGEDAAMLELDLYYYTFSYRVHQGWGVGMCKWRVQQDANQIRRGEFGIPALAVADAGYHLSYFLSPEGVVSKIDSFMHWNDIAKDVPRDPAWIGAKMRAGQDLFGRTVQIERVTPNGNLPAVVRENLPKYQALGWVE